MGKVEKFFVAFLFVMLFMGISGIAEEITLTTYYPAPYGVYEHLQVVSGSGTTPTLLGDDTLIVQKNANATDNVAITIVAGDQGNATIYFSDKDAQIRGEVTYLHATDTIRISTGGTSRVVIDSSGITVSGTVDATGFTIGGTAGWSGSYSTGGAPETITVVDGIVTDVI